MELFSTMGAFGIPSYWSLESSLWSSNSGVYSLNLMTIQRQFQRHFKNSSRWGALENRRAFKHRVKTRGNKERVRGRRRDECVMCCCREAAHSDVVWHHRGRLSQQDPLMMSSELSLLGLTDFKPIIYTSWHLQGRGEMLLCCLVGNVRNNQVFRARCYRPKVR